MLTARFVSTITVTQRTDYPDATVPGLVLRVTPTGAKTWCLRYRTSTGHAKRYTLGSTDQLTLSKARLKARQALHAVASGHDPAEAKRTAKAGSTVGDLAKDYLEKYAKVYKRSWREDERMLTAEVLPHWKARKVRDLTRRDVRVLIERIVDRGSPITANRCLALVRKMLNVAIQQDWIDANPAALMTAPGIETSRDRVLTDDELRLFWRLCEQERPIMAAFLKLRLLTAQRGGELAKLTWAAVTDDALIIPATVAKNGRAHRVPLSPMAQTLLKALPKVNDWLFPGRFDYAPMSDLKKAGQRIADRMTTLLRQTDPKATADFRGHDLRRTAATRMAEAGIPQADISRVLNHSEKGPRATQVYQRYEFDKEKRVALETLARVIQAILDEKDQSSVVPFVR